LHRLPNSPAACSKPLPCQRFHDAGAPAFIDQHKGDASRPNTSLIGAHGSENATRGEFAGVFGKAMGSDTDFKRINLSAIHYYLLIELRLPSAVIEMTRHAAD